MLITDAVVQASLFAHARVDGADIVVTAGDEITRLKRELVTYDAMAGEARALHPGLEPVGDLRHRDLRLRRQCRRLRDERRRYLEHGLWRRLPPKGGPAGTAPQAKDSTANAVHGTCDVAGATVEDNALWDGKCILFDNGPRLRVDDNPAIEDADRISIEAWVHTLSRPTRAVICRGFSWYLFGPDNRLQYDIAAALGNGPGATSSAPTTRTSAPTTSGSI